MPGSHARWDTPQEHACRAADAKDQAGGVDMPGGTALELGAGDGAIFHPHSIHKGVYPGPSMPRRTVAVSFSAAARAEVPTAEKLVAHGLRGCEETQPSCSMYIIASHARKIERPDLASVWPACGQDQRTTNTLINSSPIAQRQQINLTRSALRVLSLTSSVEGSPTCRWPPRSWRSQSYTWQT